MSVFYIKLLCQLALKGLCTSVYLTNLFHPVTYLVFCDAGRFSSYFSDPWEFYVRKMEFFFKFWIENIESCAQKKNSKILCSENQNCAPKTENSMVRKCIFCTPKLERHSVTWIMCSENGNSALNFARTIEFKPLCDFLWQIKQSHAATPKLKFLRDFREGRGFSSGVDHTPCVTKVFFSGLSWHRHIAKCFKVSQMTSPPPDSGTCAGSC